FTLIGLTRVRFGPTDGADPHYVYIGAVFLLPLLANAVADFPWRSVWQSALVVLFAFAVLGNLVALGDVALSQSVVMSTQQQELQTMAVFRGAPDMAMESSPDPAVMPQMTPARYFPAVDALGSPVPKATIDSLHHLSS